MDTARWGDKGPKSENEYTSQQDEQCKQVMDHRNCN